MYQNFYSLFQENQWIFRKGCLTVAVDMGFGENGIRELKWGIDSFTTIFFEMFDGV